MISISNTFSSFSTNDIDKTLEFYTHILGIEVKTGPVGMPELQLPGGLKVGVYQKENHVPADFTVLNLMVDDVEATVDELNELGVEMEKYEGFNQDEKGIARVDGRPPAAWFTDPGKNVISLFQNE